ncbi:hypothetical protein BU16DRAFT_509204 [Lophium mytilinum]|uniref:RING-type domain-containing protein n=1 Tax=Lophium mytilinum TaxID=390894 RepID=A0A6A6QX94_9PEZI|nr:hypothetical protein BU16DRAFT_509204 [Lophium mytilinum]
MDYTLRCNSLKCRSQLNDRAVVTTCSHVFCIHCSDSLGLSSSAGIARTCPACSTQLSNPDDAVVAQLNPTEDYKTSILSGLSPNIIMECASRGLAFYSYQTSQEIVYQEYLAKTLTENYGNLSQQMDKLILEANSEIKTLQDKLQAAQTEQKTLEQKNHELVEAFREKSKTQQQIQKLYQSLKAQVMASHVATAATDEAEHTIHTSRRDRFVDRIPGTRTGLQHQFQQFTLDQQGGPNQHRHQESVSSGSRGGQGRETINVMGPPTWTNQAPGSRNWTAQSAHISATPSQHRSRLPVAHSGVRNNSFLGGESSQQFGNAMNSQPLHDLNSNGGGPSGYRFSNGLKSSSRLSGGLRRTAAANLHRGTASQNLPVR